MIKNIPCAVVVSVVSFLGLTNSGVADEQPQFLAKFNQSVNADVLVGGQVASLNRGQITSGNQGKDGEGALIAVHNLQDFSEVNGGATPPSNSGLKYELGNTINPKAGTIEMWVKPYFNGKSINGKSVIYYLFDTGIRNPEKKTERLHGIQWVLTESGLDTGQKKRSTQVFFTFENGKQVSFTQALEWEPKTWHHLALTWDENNITLWVDNKKGTTRPSQGALKLPEETFTVGTSWYSTWPLQGVLDDVKISDGVLYKE